jgi:HD-GYP domain-containing protein (c-di-GMP phosphodiesterase class II)
LSDAQLQAFAQSLNNKKTTFAPLSVKKGVLVLDIFQPIFDLGIEGEQKISGVLMSSSRVTNDLLNFLGEGPLSLVGERTSFTQQRNGSLEMVEVTGDKSHTYGIKHNLLANILAGKRTQYEFAAFVSPIDQTYVYGASSYVVGTPFSILQEFDEDFAMSNVSSFARSIYTMMFLVMLIVSALFFAVVAYLIGTRNRHRVSHQQQIINALVRAVEIRDPYLRGHHERIARMALGVSNKMRLNVAERGTVYYAAMLSGVGKIFVPQKVMLKPSALTAKEQEIMQEHISHAMKVFKGIDFDFPIAEVINEMHERIDGSGYPLGKSGSQINLLSRIVAACDVYCALTKPRSYREELSSQSALDLMRDPSSGLDKGVIGVLANVVKKEK